MLTLRHFANAGDSQHFMLCLHRLCHFTSWCYQIFSTRIHMKNLLLIDHPLSQIRYWGYVEDNTSKI